MVIVKLIIVSYFVLNLLNRCFVIGDIIFIIIFFGSNSKFERNGEKLCMFCI